jgi:hypothetical protein
LAKVVIVLLLLLLVVLTLVIVDEEEFGRRRCDASAAGAAAAPLPMLPLRFGTTFSITTPPPSMPFSSVTAVVAAGLFRLESFRKRLDMMMNALFY